MKRLLLWLTARLPMEIIEHQGQPFLERYYVGRFLGWVWYIHRFIGSDPDGLHDHPWRYAVSIVLSGWYEEETRYGIEGVSFANVVPGTKFHRVLVPQGHECWTLFGHTARCKPWGFLRRSPSGDQRYDQASGDFREQPFPVWHRHAPTRRALCSTAPGWEVE